MKIVIAQTKHDIERCFPVMLQLRPALSRKQFLNRVLRQQKAGYRLAFVEDSSQVVAVAGFRISERLASGKFMYVDDLITDEENRSKGYGSRLFDWLVARAKKERCKEFELDSGVHRFDAHRFYLKKRMHITCHHFRLLLDA